LSSLEGAQWIPDLGGLLGFPIGVGVGIAIACFGGVGGIGWAIVIVLLGCILGPISGFVIGAIYVEILVRSINKRKMKRIREHLR
jgi:hypothetical protein